MRVESIACRSSGMQPVPVQRSRIRSRESHSGQVSRDGSFVIRAHMDVARCIVYASVSGLNGFLVTILNLDAPQTDRGIKVPGLQIISKSPNGWLPRIYCNGLPLDRSTHSCCNCWRHTRRVGQALVAVRTCSRSQRSSLRAELRSRHARRRSGSSGST